MQPRITVLVLTLGVDDLDRSLQFYRDGLGFCTEGIVGTEFEHGAVAFFKLQEGLQLAIWRREDIAHDTGIPRSAPSAAEFTIGHNVASKQEVDEVIEQVRKAGAKITVAPHDSFWGGYSGYFKIPMDICGKLFGTLLGRIKSSSNVSCLPINHYIRALKPLIPCTY